MANSYTIVFSGNLIPGKYTKTGKLRTVYILAKPLIEALSSWKALRINERAMLSEDDSESEYYRTAPTLIVEVLSASTRKKDRTEK